MQETALRLTMTDTGEEIVFPDGSAFGVETDLQLIGSGNRLRRTVNAKLVNISDPAFDKFLVTLSASDMILPAIAGLRHGDAVTVECPLVIRERGATPSRPAVPGTVSTGPGWVEYRPVLDCLVDDPVMSERESKAEASWSLRLEEV